MHQPRGDAQLFSRLAGEPCKQPRHVMCIQPVQRTPQAIVIEILRHDAWPQQMLKRLVLKELWDYIQSSETSPQPVEDHRHRRCPDAHLPLHIRLLRIEIGRHP